MDRAFFPYFLRSAIAIDWLKLGIVGCLLSFHCFTGAAAPTGTVTATSIQNFAVGENSRAEVLINAYVGDDPSTFRPGATIVDNVINAADSGGCAQVLINSATAYPCSTGGADSAVGSGIGSVGGSP